MNHSRIQPRLRQVVVVTIVACLMFGSFVAGHISGTLARPAQAQSSEPAEFRVFWEVWDLVLEHFVDQDKIDFKAMTYGAIDGMLRTLGDENHTAFFSPEVAERQASSLEGSFEGIGAYVDSSDGQFIIVAPILGSPAEAAGILAGDLVLAVDGVDVTGMQEWEVINLIRGPAGTSVVVTVLHPDATEPVDISIVRGRIDLESVLWARVPGTDIVHLQITQFADDTGSELRNALAAILADSATPVKGIILDLRNNPGGYLQEALRVGNQFLDDGLVILHEQDAQDNLVTYRARGSGLARRIPMVVLVNAGSASAAEILAGALQENDRAKVVGQPTVGTGTVLRPFTLSDGSVLRLGVTNWLTPDQRLIKGEGIQPDVLVEQDIAVEMISSTLLSTLSETELRTHPDRQFHTALLLLKLQLNENSQAQVPAITP